MVLIVSFTMFLSQETVVADVPGDYYVGLFFNEDNKGRSIRHDLNHEFTVAHNRNARLHHWRRGYFNKSASTCLE